MIIRQDLDTSVSKSFLSVSEIANGVTNVSLADAVLTSAIPRSKGVAASDQVDTTHHRVHVTFPVLALPAIPSRHRKSASPRFERSGNSDVDVMQAGVDLFITLLFDPRGLVRRIKLWSSDYAEHLTTSTPLIGSASQEKRSDQRVKRSASIDD